MKVVLRPSMNDSIAPGTDGFDAIADFQSVFTEVGSVVLGRDSELHAIKLCIVAGANALIQGPWGAAKSMLVSEIFSRIIGAVCYKKQLTKTTQSDEVFGPMIRKRYQEDAVWEHNTARMLPSAHFAFLDELYNAADLLLPSMLGVLNEREFINGGVPQQCPLVSAIGTCNLRTDLIDLEPFHDRWLVWLRINFLDRSLRVSMFEDFLRRSRDTETDRATVTLTQVRLLNQLVCRVAVSNTVLELYERIISAYMSQSKNAFVLSDRRLNQSLRLMQASALLLGRTEVLPEDFENLRYSFCHSPHANPSTFDGVYASEIGSYVQEQEAQTKIGKLEEFTTRLVSKYDPSMSKEAKAVMLKQVDQVASSVLASLRSGSDFHTVRLQNAAQSVVRRLEELKLSLTEKS